MKIQSPLSNLRDVLANVKATASSYKQTLDGNEAATRLALIDPVLTALGWDLTNPTMVEVEKNVRGIWADYVLNDEASKPLFVVEAKKLGQLLGQNEVDAIMRVLVGYTAGLHVNDVFLTNGLIWQHYSEKISLSGAKPDKEFDIANADLGEMAAYLIQKLDSARFWADEQSVDTLSQDVKQLQSDVASLQAHIAAQSATSPGQPQPAAPALSLDWKDLATLAGSSSLTGTTPSQLRLPDGSTVLVSAWSRVLAEVCKFVLENNLNVQLPFPDRAQRAVNLIDTVSPPKGIAFVKTFYQGQQIYIRTTYSANDHAANALHILKQLTPQQQAVKAAVVYA